MFFYQKVNVGDCVGLKQFVAFPYTDDTYVGDR